MTPLTPVDSSSIDSIGHDSVENVLKVRFKNGATYIYQHVTAEIHKAIMEAESVGSYFANTIKKHPTLFPFEKVE